MTYCDTPVLVSGKAMIIEDDHVVICDSQVCLDAYLPIEDLASLESDQTISVVGIINDIQDLEITWGGMPYKSPHYIMETGFLVH